MEYLRSACRFLKSCTAIRQVLFGLKASFRHASSSPMEYEKAALYSPFLFNFVVADVLQKASSELLDDPIELLSGNRFLLRVCRWYRFAELHNAQAIQNELGRLTIEVFRYGMRFAPSKCNVLLQDRQESVPALTLYADWLEVINSITCLGSLIPLGGGVGDVTLQISEDRAKFWHLWRRHDTRLSSTERRTIL